MQPQQVKIEKFLKYLSLVKETNASLETEYPEASGKTELTCKVLQIKEKKVMLL